MNDHPSLSPNNENSLSVKGVSINNLRHLSVSIPHGKHTVCTGVSGCGKSSLVFDCIYALCEYELLQSLSTYARGNIPLPAIPDIEHASGLLPPVVIDQGDLGSNPRSTVGTVTEAFTLLRLLFARGALPILDASCFSFNSPQGACLSCSGLGTMLTPDLNSLFDLTKSLNDGAIRHRAWKVGSRYWNIIQASSLFDMSLPLRAWSKDQLETIIHSPPIEVANKVHGFVQRFTFEGIVVRLKHRLSDQRGLDSRDYDIKYFTMCPCIECGGTRLNKRALECSLNGINIAKAAKFAVPDLKAFIIGIHLPSLSIITKSLVRILDNLELVGLAYLALDRPTSSLSGGEAQRIKIARELGSRLTGMLYILDEPSLGLHPKNVESVNTIINSLKKRGNTILSVEHNALVVRLADHIVELGPGAGARGGLVTTVGSPESFRSSDGPTARLLCPQQINVMPRTSNSFQEWHHYKNLHLHNLQIEKLSVPKNAFTCLVGVSGSGKSSILQEVQNQEPNSVRVAQKQIGTSIRSNICTYIGFFDEIRRLFAQKVGVPAGMFAFNSEGACPECGGRGSITLDLHFMGSTKAPCTTCNGKRYRVDVLEHTWKELNIAQVLDLSVDEAMQFFSGSKKIEEQLQLLSNCGLGYIRLGQSLDTFSGGELQRVKLIEGVKDSTPIYLLDEPARGLHPDDVKHLLTLVRNITSQGKTVVASEHDLAVIAQADWIIEIGPGAANAGGRVVAAGTVQQILNDEKSITSQFLKPYVT